MPGLRLSGFQCSKVTLHKTVFAKGPHIQQMSAADLGAGGGKALQGWYAAKLLVQGNQFSTFIARGMQVGFADSREFKRKQVIQRITLEKILERREIGNLPERGEFADESGIAGMPDLVEQSADIAREGVHFDRQYFPRFVHIFTTRLMLHRFDQPSSGKGLVRVYYRIIFRWKTGLLHGMVTG